MDEQKPTTNHPADLADALERLPAEEASQVVNQLPTREAAAVLGEVESDSRQEIVESLTPGEVAKVVAAMPHDQAADLLGDLDESQRRAVLRTLPVKPRREIVRLLRFPADTAGGIMSDQFLAVQPDETVGQVLQRLQRLGDTISAQPITYLYVTDSTGRLQGVVPLRELVFGGPDRMIGRIMRTEVTRVHPDDDQEKIAQLFQQYHYLALPVVDNYDRLLGIVSSSQVLEVLQDEATEDMQLMVGLSGEESTRTPWQKSFPMRLKWLCINLATAFLAGAVIQIFEGTIAQWTALAIFLPIIAGQGGNAGIQTLTVIIREMALGELKSSDGWRALSKEAMLGLLNGLAIGLIVGLAGFFWKQSPELGLIIGLAMLLNMLAAALAGVLVPFGLKAMRVDPALASGIVVTTVTDVAGFVFFLGLASFVLHWVR